MPDDKFRGYPIEKHGEHYVFSDTGEPVASSWEKRPCGHCGLRNTPEGYDGCIGEVKDAINACCGHGNVAEAYVQYAGKGGDNDGSGRIVRGEEARKIFRG